MFEATEVIAKPLLLARQERCRNLIRKRLPECGGVMIFSRVNIYYLTGTFAMGFLWLPLEGEPVLGVRKGVPRANLESPGLKTIVYGSYSKVAAQLAECGSPLSPTFAVEEQGLNWSLGQNFSQKMREYNLISADFAVSGLRSVKDSFELEKLIKCGLNQHEGQCTRFLEQAHVGMSEYEISALIWKNFLDMGHSVMGRMSCHGGEMVLGHVTVGENGMYPSYFDGPMGVKGFHPTAAYMGDKNTFWQEGQILGVDIGFAEDGYNTDKTQIFFAGKESAIPAKALQAHECCLNIQYELAKRLRPGAIPHELYFHALKMADEAGFAEGFMGLGSNKVAFVGHGIGLQVDEFPVLAKKFEEPVQENMVIALEPKIALPGFGMVGVENTFIVGADKTRCITEPDQDLEPLVTGRILCVY